MNNDKINDEWLYNLSEESLIHEWDNEEIENIKYDFSEEYKEFRKNLIQTAHRDDIAKSNDYENKKCEITDLVSFKAKKHRRRRFSGISAATVAVSVLIFSVGAYALVHFYDVILQKNNEGNYTYQVQYSEDAYLQPVKLILNYIPEGYEINLSQNEEEQDDVKKYKKIDGTGGFTVGVRSYSKIDEKLKTSEIEQTQLAGVPAIVFSIDESNIEYNHRIEMYFEDMGHVISLYAQPDISLDELKKIADNLEVFPTDGDMYKINTTEETKEMLDNSLGILKGVICEETIIPMETSVDLDGELSMKIKDIEYLDNISELPNENFTYDLSSYTDENGNFKVLDLLEQTGKGNEILTTQTIKGRYALAYLTLEVTNLTDQYLKNEFVQLNLQYKYSMEDMDQSAWKNVFLDGRGMEEPVYFDSTDQTNDPDIHTKYISDFEPGKTRIIHMGLLYLKEREDEAYISMRSWIGHLDDRYVKLVENKLLEEIPYIVGYDIE